MSEISTISLALQGGGAHGAFTWGVLDTLLERGNFHFDGVSGTSAGAMNAVCLAHGLMEGGADGARQALERFWLAVADTSPFPASGESGAEVSAALKLMLRWTDHLTPEQLNPFDLNPLRDIVAEHVRFRPPAPGKPGPPVHRGHPCQHRPVAPLPQPGTEGRHPARLGLPADHPPHRRHRRRTLLGWRLQRQPGSLSAGLGMFGRRPAAHPAHAVALRRNTREGTGHSRSPARTVLQFHLPARNAQLRPPSRTNITRPSCPAWLLDRLPHGKLERRLSGLRFHAISAEHVLGGLPSDSKLAVNRPFFEQLCE